CYDVCSLLMSICWFFFSSRRRHTRFSRDWSSDVCSSDLAREVIIGFGHPVYTVSDPRNVVIKRVAASLAAEAGSTRMFDIAERRSEERRVGKECRSGRAPERWKKKR